MEITITYSDLKPETILNLVEEIKERIKSILKDKAKENKMSLKEYVLKNYCLSIEKNFESVFEAWLEDEADRKIDEFKTFINLDY